MTEALNHGIGKRPQIAVVVLLVIGAVGIACSTALMLSAFALAGLLALVYLSWQSMASPRAHAWAGNLRGPAVHAMLASVALWGLLALSTVWSIIPASQSLHAALKYRSFLLLPLFALFLLSATHRQLVLRAFQAGCLLLMGLSYAVAWHWIAPIGRYGEPGNAVIFRHHITHSLLMAIFAFQCLQIAIDKAQPCWRWRIPAACAGFAAILNVLMLVQGRTGYVVVFVLFAYALWLYLPRPRLGGVPLSRVRSLLLAAFLSAAAAVLTYQTVPTFQQRIDSIFTEITAFKSHRAPTSAGLRVYFWSRSLDIWRDHPLLGVGVGAWRTAYNHYADPNADAEFFGHGHPHNEYLHIAVQAGGLGLAMFLLFMLLCTRTMTKLRDPHERANGTALMLALSIGLLLNCWWWDAVESHLFALLLAVYFATSLAERSGSGNPSASTT